MKTIKEHPKAFGIALLAVLVVGLIAAYYISHNTTRTILLTLDDSRTKVSNTFDTKSYTIEEFLKESKISFDPEAGDLISVPVKERIRDGMELTIYKAFPVDVIADGAVKTVNTTSVTVWEIMQQLELTIDADDIAEPALNHYLLKGDSITITRVEIKEEEEKVETPFSRKYQNNSELDGGTISVATPGVPGLTTNTYRTIYHDGVEYKKDLIKTEETQAMQDEIVHVGTRIMSELSSAEGMAQNPIGYVPEGLSYSQVITVKAVAYSAPAGSHGAYGGLCTYGTCAVDRTVIPLGTRLYIEGYGFAIANDVGSGVKGNMVDLFMLNNSECLQWGAHYVNVYILD